MVLVFFTNKVKKTAADQCLMTAGAKNDLQRVSDISKSTRVKRSYSISHLRKLFMLYRPTYISTNI
jgi:hypothetical protein